MIYQMACGAKAPRGIMEPPCYLNWGCRHRGHLVVRTAPDLLVHLITTTNVFLLYVKMAVDRTENRLQPYVLPDDYIDRWVELAKWSLEKQHGPSAR